MRAHKMASLIPSMSTESFAALKEDVRKHGILEPIWTKDGKIIDGRHRYRAWAELKKEGVDLPAPEFRECNEDDLHAFVLSMNIIRRQLSRTQTRALIKKLLVTFPKKADRVIARMARVNDKTVTAVRRVMTATAEIPQSDTRTGADGRTRKQPVKRKRKPGKGYADVHAQRIIDDLARFDLSLLVDARKFINELSAQVARLSAIINGE